MAIPAKAPFDVIALLMGVPGDNVLDCAGKYVTVMR